MNKLNQLNDISDKTVTSTTQQVTTTGAKSHNVLWNIPTLGKNYSYGLPLVYKTSLFLSFERKKTGPNSSIFSGIAQYLGCVKKQPEISGIALF